MGTYTDLKQQIINKPERHYVEYKDANGQLTDPVNPFVYFYNPEAVEVASGIPTKESTGVYYYTLTLASSTSTVIEGIYQAWWQGEINGAFQTMDEPHYFYVKFVPWQLDPSTALVQSVRRLIGDLNPSAYRISTQDMFYYLQDAVDDVNAQLLSGNYLTIEHNSATFAASLTTEEKALYRLKTLILVKEATLNDSLFDGAAISVGDIKIDVSGMIRARTDDLKRLQEGYNKLIYDIKMNSLTGYEVDTYVTGILQNSGNIIDQQYYNLVE